MSSIRCKDNRKSGMMTRAHQPCLNSASSWSQRRCVGILRAVGHKGRNSHFSHYHETSGLAQTREESVHTTQYIYKILHCHTKTHVPHCEALAPNIQILNMNNYSLPSQHIPITQWPFSYYPTIMAQPPNARYPNVQPINSYRYYISLSIAYDSE